MKSMKFIVILAAFFAAFVSVSFGAEAKLEKLDPPRQVKFQSITSGGDETVYDIDIVPAENKGVCRFTTDREGVLVRFDAVLEDYTVASFSRREGEWISNDSAIKRPMLVDMAAWAKFFTEKVAPVPVKMFRMSGYLQLEGDVKWEYLGYLPGARMIALRQVGTPIVRNLNENEFAMSPPKDKSFYLGKMDGLYYAVVEMKSDTTTTYVIEARLSDPPNRVAASR
jgi:hypothetical protein